MLVRLNLLPLWMLVKTPTTRSNIPPSSEQLVGRTRLSLVNAGALTKKTAPILFRAGLGSLELR